MHFKPTLYEISLVVWALLLVNRWTDGHDGFNEWFSTFFPNSPTTEEAACYTGQILTSSLVKL
jgi:hypothetical protein